MITDKDTAKDNCEPGTISLEPAIHRRILNFLNEAISPIDLEYEKPFTMHAEGHLVQEDDLEEMRTKRKKILDHEIAKRIIDFRGREYPLGFRHLKEVFGHNLFDVKILDTLRHHFSEIHFGSWATFPQNIPLRGNGTIDGVIHAALLHTSKVLFVTADETTLLWNPEDVTPSTFENPRNQPHTMPEGYSQLCGHHVFLSDGTLLSVGGGGYGHNPLARWGYKFDPVTESWSRTSNSMSESRWYPTAVALGDQRVLVTCGHGGGDMNIYNEATDTFHHDVAGDTKGFPSLYPGLHLLPSHAIFYSRTGWGSAGDLPPVVVPSFKLGWGSSQARDPGGA